MAYLTGNIDFFSVSWVHYLQLKGMDNLGLVRFTAIVTGDTTAVGKNLLLNMEYSLEGKALLQKGANIFPSRWS